MNHDFDCFFSLFLWNMNAVRDGDIESESRHAAFVLQHAAPAPPIPNRFVNTITIKKNQNKEAKLLVYLFVPSCCCSIAFVVANRFRAACPLCAKRKWKVVTKTNKQTNQQTNEKRLKSWSDFQSVCFPLSSGPATDDMNRLQKRLHTHTHTHTFSLSLSLSFHQSLSLVCLFLRVYLCSVSISLVFVIRRSLCLRAFSRIHLCSPTRPVPLSIRFPCGSRAVPVRFRHPVDWTRPNRTKRDAHWNSADPSMQSSSSSLRS